MLNAALSYAQRGFSVIPVRPDKKPFVSWVEFQKRKASESEIRAWWQKWPQAMIGLVTGEISGLFVIDCDTQEGFETVQGHIPDSLLLPIARTPRGGWHLYFQYPEGSKLSIAAGVSPGVDFRGNGGYVVAPPSHNEKGSYTWQAGLSIFEVAPPPLPPAVFNIILFNYNTSIFNTRIIERDDIAAQNFLREGRRDQDLFHVANTLVKGGCEIPVIHKVLNILAKNCTPPFPQDEIPLKIQSALQRSERKERNIQREGEEWVSVTEGYWTVTECYSALQVLQKDEKAAVRVAIHRLYKENGLIEKHGTRNGVYRRIEREVDDIDFINAPQGGLDIRWPFSIEKYVKLLPKNIVVVAGASNSGKTAFLLNAIYLNQDKYKIIYFSSEMGGLELRSRLERFEIPLTSWKFTAKERSSNFADVIEPDAINIIDFLELHADFWQVGGMIKAIYDKLTTGIAVIALQKNPGVEHGLGGSRSVEKARLYLSLDQNVIKISKAKNWVAEENPNGLSCRFKLVDGCRFLKQGDWFREKEKR